MESSRALIIISAVLLIAVMIPGISAVTLKAENIDKYSFDAPTGSVIYEIVVDQLPMNVDQTHTLKVGSATYYLTVHPSNPYSIYYDFDIGLTFPNGTTTNIHKSVTRLPGAGYKTVIQPVYATLESTSFMLWTVDLEIGTSNQSLSAGINTGPVGWSPSEALPFTSAQGTFGSTLTNVFLYTMTYTEYQNNVVTYNPSFGLGVLGTSVFQWVWDTVIGFLNQIPVIGPQLVSIIDTLGGIVQEIISWLSWILINLPMFIAATEVTIVMASICFAEKKPKVETVGKNIVKYNIAVFKGFIWAFNLIYGWLREFIIMVATVVRALNPL